MALPLIIYNIIIMVIKVTIKCPKMLGLWSKIMAMDVVPKIMPLRPMIMDHLTGRTLLKYETRVYMIGCL